MLPHRIRLRGPWRVWPIVAGDAGPRPSPERTIKMPTGWDRIGLGDFHGTVRFSRSFGCPRHIDPDERAWLIIEDVSRNCVVSLNGMTIGAWSSDKIAEVDVTESLRERNELRLELPAGDRGMPWTEAALEFRGQAWLQRLSVRRIGERLELAGTVMGQTENALDLYAVLGRTPVIHTKVQAGPNGRSFRVASGPLFDREWPLSVLVELVHESAVWHSENVSLSKAEG
jgi:hypothetical protein